MNYLSASGLVCEVNGGTVTIDRCYVAGTIVGFGRGGSLVGSVNGDYVANITNSYSIADVTVDDNGYTYNYRAGGGLIGFLNTGTINMDSCYYYGTGLEARSSGMGGAIISHFAGGTFNCTNTYYNSDKNAAEYAGYEYGTGATEAEFADGTVLALLNGESEAPVFEQGELYPVFAATSEVCEHTDVASEWSSDEENHWHVCNVCGEAADVAAHASARWRCGKIATTEEDGLRYKICDVCGARFGDEVVPKIAMPVIEPGDGVPEIVVESKNAAPGKTVNVKIAIKNNPGIASMKLTVEFDEGLTLKTPVVYDIAPEETDPEMPQVIQPADAGGASPVILNWISPLANIEGDVIYATLTFEVAADAEGEQNITVTYNPNDIYNLAEENIGFAVTNGKITISESGYIAGDINGDGEVDNKDLTRLFQYLSNWDVEIF